MAKILSTTQPVPINSTFLNLVCQMQNAPLVLALRVERAAAAIDVSEDYLAKAIRQGRIKATRKLAKGKGRGVVLIMIDELWRFACTDEGIAEEGGSQ